MKLMILLGVAAAVLVYGPARGAKEPEKGKQKEVIYVSADSATFADVMPGISIAAVWGDREKGGARHLHQVRPRPGQRDALSYERPLDVLKRAYLYKDDAGEKRIGPGEFIRIPGGHKHGSGGDKTEGALFYEEGKGKFDLIPAK